MLYLQSFLALLLMLGLLWILYRLFQRFQDRIPGLSRPRRIQVVERTSLGERRSLLLVSVGEAQFLVGSTPQNLSLLARIDSPPLEEAADAPQTVQPTVRPQPFQAVLEESVL